MANVLKMATVNSIVTLIEGGYFDRHIADVLNVDRGTVAKYRRQSQNPPNAPAGSMPLSLTAWSAKTTANQLENKSILWHNRMSETSILLVHQSVHLLVLKAPIDGGFKRAS